MSCKRIVIVGGSYAALNTAAAVREAGFDGSVVMLSEEEFAPYQRPPLSKTFLKGELAAEDLPLKTDRFYLENEIDLLLNARAERISPHESKIELAGGRMIAYHHLVLACGARPRRLSGAPTDVLYLRNLADALALKDRLSTARHVTVLGGGFIGLETAAAAVTMGKSVRLIESGARLLARAVSEHISEVLLAKHRSAGVEIIFGAVSSFATRGEKTIGLRLDDGRTFDCDLLIAGIGSTPNDELARQAGIVVGDGIEADRYGVTSVPNVLAVGDCASHPSLWAGRRIRLESVQNAVDQARAAGATLAGRPTPYEAAPRFWSDQYDWKLQIIGLPSDADSTAVVGVNGPSSFSEFHCLGARVLSVASLNDPRTQMSARRWFALGPSAPTMAQIAGPNRNAAAQAT